MGGSRRIGRIGESGRIGRVACRTVGVVSIGLAVVGVGALAAGYRLVVVTTGSMTPAVPTGSLVIAEPTGAVEVGDILVMRREGRSTITHRVVDLNRVGSDVYATTQGDANRQIDAAPYHLRPRELVGRWVVPGVGRLLLALGSPLIGGGVVLLAVGVQSTLVLRRIWRHRRARLDRFPLGRSNHPHLRALSTDRARSIGLEENGPCARQDPRPAVSVSSRSS